MCNDYVFTLNESASIVIMLWDGREGYLVMTGIKPKLCLSSILWQPFKETISAVGEGEWLSSLTRLTKLIIFKETRQWPNLNKTYRIIIFLLTMQHTAYQTLST
jgi:hypothetical protein